MYVYNGNDGGVKITMSCTCISPEFSGVIKQAKYSTLNTRRWQKVGAEVKSACTLIGMRH